MGRLLNSQYDSKNKNKSKKENGMNPNSAKNNYDQVKIFKQYGTEVKSWDDKDKDIREKKKEQLKFLDDDYIKQLTRKRERDVLDEEYDRGRIKKVKKNKEFDVNKTKEFERIQKNPELVRYNKKMMIIFIYLYIYYY